MVAESQRYVEKNTLKNSSSENFFNKIYGEMAEWFKAVDCKSIEVSHRRFESYFLLILFSTYYSIRNMA